MYLSKNDYEILKEISETGQLLTALKRGKGEKYKSLMQAKKIVKQFRLSDSKSYHITVDSLTYEYPDPNKAERILQSFGTPGDEPLAHIDETEEQRLKELAQIGIRCIRAEGEKMNPSMKNWMIAEELKKRDRKLYDTIIGLLGFRADRATPKTTINDVKTRMEKREYTKTELPKAKPINEDGYMKALSALFALADKDFSVEQVGDEEIKKAFGVKEEGNEEFDRLFPGFDLLFEEESSEGKT